MRERKPTRKGRLFLVGTIDAGEGRYENGWLSTGPNDFRGLDYLSLVFLLDRQPDATITNPRAVTISP